MPQNVIVLSVGGSLIVPNGGIDIPFLRSFKQLIHTHIKHTRFVIVVGGGSTARHYQEAARNIGKLTRDDLDWLGIHATRLNGHLVRTIFRDIAHPVILKDPSRPIARWHKPVLIAAGWKPGWSTDYVATRLAKRLRANVVVNLSDVDYVFDKDPRKHADAKPICEILWKDFRKIVGNRWDPGMSVPFDPVASRLAHHSGIQVVIANGRKRKNLNALFSGKKFKGTIIH